MLQYKIRFLQTHSNKLTQILMKMLIRKTERIVEGIYWCIPESVSVTLWRSWSTASLTFNFQAMTMGAGWVGPRATPLHIFLANFHSSGGGGLNFFICRSEESVNKNITLKVKKKLHFVSKTKVECRVSTSSVGQIYRGPILTVPSQSGYLQSEEVMKHHK